MAVMSPQPPTSAHEQKVPSAAPTPASAGAGSLASDEAMAMDLDTSGTNKQSNSPSSPQEDNDQNSSRPPFVNGSKGITAPPSPPIPTPPLHHSSDSGHDLSDLHITSPDGSAMPQPFEDVAMEGNQEDPVDKSHDGSRPDSTTKASHSNNVSPETDQAMSDGLHKKSSRDRDDDEADDDENRPPKRAKTADATESTSPTSPSSTPTEFTGPMTQARGKFVMGVVRSLRRTKDARPFSMPVDHVKLNVPTYYQIIKKPMDLQTMERKLNSNEYPDLESFVADFRLILENCVTFNGPDHAVTAMSKAMEAAFYRHMRDLPAEDVVEVDKPKPSKKKGGHTLSGAAAASHNKSLNKTATTKQGAQSRREAKGSSAQSPPTATSPVFSLQPSGMPQIRRDSTMGDGRPKREIHPPAPKDLPYSTKPRRKQNAAELKFCDSILKELHRKAHETYAFPFYHPVDPVALNIPDYFKIIKKPMDLSSIQDKLKLNSYENATEFEADIRLMFNNCYKFNPEGQAVHQMGRQLEAVFEQKWKEKPLYNQGSRSPQSASPAPYHEEMSEEEDEELHNGNIEQLEKKLEKMKEEISAMKKSKKKTPPLPSKSKKGGNGRKNSAGTAATTKRAKKPKEVPYISLEQKTELSERINLLPPQKMHYALVMIRDMMPELGNDGAEIELDIDELDPHTLHNLYKYVSKNAPELPAKYVPPPPPPEDLHETKAKPRAGPKGRKNKPMSAAEQEAKIADIAARLNTFENPQAYAPAARAASVKVESDSSDDDESSQSESEEE